jgi:hypothetical protein
MEELTKVQASWCIPKDVIVIDDASSQLHQSNVVIGSSITVEGVLEGSLHLNHLLVLCQRAYGME